MKIVCTTLFGLEKPTKDDLLAIGYDSSLITVTDGVVTLNAPDGSWKTDLARVNMWLRHAE